MATATKPKVFIVCPGLGQVNRGFETFTRESFDSLKDSQKFDLILCKGKGKTSKNEKTLWNISRYSSFGKFLGNLSGRGAYFWESVTFFISMIPYIMLYKPKVIYFSDGMLGNFLWWGKKIFKFKYKTLVCNGAPTSPPFPRWDHIHQGTPSYLQEALNAGEPLEKQTLIPQGVNTKKLELLTPQEIINLKYTLTIPTDRKIILSVCAINKSHKRVDYLVKEISKLQSPTPILIVLGQIDEESPAIFDLAKELLGEENFIFKSVPAQVVASYYQIADVFVLCSTGEGFGRVYLEALSYGLPIVAHDYEVSRFILEEYGYYADLTKEGTLSSILKELLSQEKRPDDMIKRSEFTIKKFEWNNLKNQYEDMILALIE